MTRFKIYFTLIVAAIAFLAYALLNMEFVQKKLFDIKADITGSERTITFYSTIDATKVASYSDKDMRYETKPSGAISVWLGSKSKKVESNLGYIIEDK
jgi:hypothetical protein